MDWSEFLYTNWPIKLVSVILIVAAWIDGKDLRVPNYITLPMILSGLIFQTCVGGFSGLGAGLLGMVVGLLCLLPLYSVGGMGAGDVKLMAGIGAWVGWEATAYSFAISAFVGAFMAVVMVAVSGNWKKHYGQMLLILSEWSIIKNPYELTDIAAERKARMYLLPYGIPICIGTIGYFIHEGMI